MSKEKQTRTIYRYEEEKMGGLMRFFYCLLAAAFMFCTAGPLALAAGPIYKLSIEDLKKQKALFDDPRPYRNVLSMKKVMPPEVYAKLSANPEEMKKVWSQVVGFKAPDVVGKIALEVKPGKYTYKDKDRLPFKELMIPNHYQRFAPQVPPHAGNFSEITVVPTRQQYYHTRIGEATKLSNARLDSQGYLVPDSYKGGFPFPKPSGPHKAQQIVYNWVKRYLQGDSQHGLQVTAGFNKNLVADFEGLYDFYSVKLHARVYQEPYGWLDERAEKNGEQRCYYFGMLAPRDIYGNVVSIMNYLDPNKFDLFFLYVNSLRRLRRLSATDAQDAAVGQDVIYEDFEGFNQQLTPKRYPYKYKVIAEREYIIPFVPPDGSSYYTNKGEIKNVNFERRPVYVIELQQQDPNFIYSRRIMYIDMETFMMHLIENYDKKGRLYRTCENISYFYEDLGVMGSEIHTQRDYLDLHSIASRTFIYPAAWAGREQISLRGLARGTVK
jgi:hypothetical protein